MRAARESFGAVSLLAALVLVPSAGADSGGCPGPARLRIVWENVERIGAARSAPVEREVRRLFRPSGVAIEWRSRASDVGSRGDEISVVILPEPRSQTLPAHAMGAVNRGSSRIWLFLAGIGRLLGHSANEGADDDGMTARLIGRVIAHEIVHVILPQQSHTHDGLMQARWDRAFAFRPQLSADRDLVRAFRAAVTCPAPPTSGSVAALGGSEGDYSDDPSSS